MCIRDSNGTDRFRWDDNDGKGTFYCGGGGDPTSGDGFGLVKHVFNCDFPAAARWVEQVLLGKCHEDIPYRAPPPKPGSDSYRKIWVQTRPDEIISWDKKVADHPYARRKQITHACGAARGQVTGSRVGKNADVLIIPKRTLAGDLCGVEIIAYPRLKKNEWTTPKQSFGTKGVLVLGNTLDKTLPVYITEGWADAYWAWSLNGNVVAICCFGKRQEEVRDQMLKENLKLDITLIMDAEK